MFDAVDISVVKIIQAMLAPGLMVSACGLFLLGMNNKYSLVVNRIRLMNEERRKLDGCCESQIEKNRRDSIRLQLPRLDYRVKLIRNAVFSFSIAVAFFIISSFFIGLYFWYSHTNISFFVLLFFLLGMFSMLCGALYAAIELWHGYRIIKIDIDN